MLRALHIAVGISLGVLIPTLSLADTVVSPIVQLATKERYDDDPIVLGRTEYYSEISPQGGVQLSGDTLQLQAWYTADVMYEAVAEDAEVDHRVHFELHDKASDHVTLNSDLGFWRVSDPTSLPRLGIATIDAPVLYTLDKVGLSDALSRRWTWDIDYQFEAAQILGAEANPPIVPPVPNSPLGAVQTPATDVRYALSERAEIGLKDRYQLFTSSATFAGQADSLYGIGKYRLTESWLVKGEVGPTAFDDTAGHTTLVPHLQGEVEHDGKYTEVGLVAGRDLIGAVGYAAVVWAEFAQLALAVHPIKDLRVFVIGGVFENGMAPVAPVDLQGYSAAGGLTYNFTREVAGTLSAMHIYSQGVGPVAPGADPFLSENTNIASVQLAWTPVIESKHL